MADTFAQIAVGQRLWGEVIIPKSNDYIVPKDGASEGTSKKILAGKPVKKNLIVLQHNGDTVDVVYQSSFNGAANLAGRVTEAKDWYPVTPAVGSYDPLPQEPPRKDKKPTVGAWFNLQHVMTLSRSGEYIVLEGNVYSADSVLKLKHAVDARTGKKNFKNY